MMVFGRLDDRESPYPAAWSVHCNQVFLAPDGMLDPVADLNVGCYMVRGTVRDTQDVVNCVSFLWLAFFVAHL